MKPTITRVGERIVKIRFEVTCDKPLIQYHSILYSLPDDQARREWMSRPFNIAIADGWAEVTPR
jgi:hypothetical protein